MKKTALIFTLMITFLSCKQEKKQNIETEKHLESELISIQKWFNAWELVATDLLKIKPHQPPLMLFYDHEFSYTNSKNSVKNAIKIKGPNFFGKELSWTKTKHNDTLTLPTGEKVPLGLMSFTASIEEDSKKAYFVMGVPSFWKQANVKSKELGDENLYTSVFLHEFAHALQNKNFGVKLDELNRNHDFKIELSDDMIQEDFEKDSLYVKKIKAEIKIFYDAFYAENSSETKKLMQQGFALYNKRQKDYFLGDKEIYKSLDDFFLTMEGIGQYTAVAWLTSSKGANLDLKLAIDGMRRNKKWWSQEEGLALFLLYTKISNPELGAEMFGTDLHKINELLAKQIN